MDWQTDKQTHRRNCPIHAGDWGRRAWEKITGQPLLEVAPTALASSTVSADSCSSQYRLHSRCRPFLFLFVFSLFLPSFILVLLSPSMLLNLPLSRFSFLLFELAGIVTSILNKSFSTGTVPSQWLTAVVTPVPKKSSPTELSDYRPISVTPILSRLAEKIFVQQWLRPALPMELLKDQYAFRPTGSTCCTMVDFIDLFIIPLLCWKITHIFADYLLTSQKHLM